jgi:carbon monoxide dehydrogenase subunit G
MPLEFHGTEQFAVTPQRLFAVVTDLDALAASIPDLVSSERVDERSLRCVVRPGFSFLRGSLKLHLRLDDLQPPETAKMLVDSQGIGVTMRAESQLRITPESAGSRLDWETRVVEMKGLIASVSPGLIQAAANQVTKTAWQKFRERLDYV